MCRAAPRSRARRDDPRAGEADWSLRVAQFPVDQWSEIYPPFVPAARGTRRWMGHERETEFTAIAACGKSPQTGRVRKALTVTRCRAGNELRRYFGHVGKLMAAKLPRRNKPHEPADIRE